eukprot:CAMPEP_0197687534 /NCGR_PEP_ID=MMETSP1338-20131121/104103_1 /TAXON_ID=43686 ORGANISM="Pelagodinium beii, Strain RCC1491" /NCGR_SAMPLE_ID=MMETSP1338 /ASSEMBLY_ACC=CAM_ASM_000754 /LENGTH=593 /DNA_ID=CAMNT_0043269641 /DNA_START=46 /DNA_END=1825 /DNA_ORIENTATION=-
MDPTSPYRLLWDLFGMSSLAFDMTIIPLVLCFEKADALWIDDVSRVCTIYWTLDLIVSFFCGYQTSKKIEMELANIVTHYLKGFFLFDLFLVITDWVGALVLDRGAQTLRLGKTLSRGMRIVRILRLLKIRRSFGNLSERMNSESGRVFLRTGQILIFLVVFNHLTACLFFLVGSSGSDEHTDTWVKRNELDGRALTYQYLTSLHWAVTQGAPAGMEVNPTNATERIFAIVTVIIALLTFSSFVSNITANMSHLQIANSRRTMEMVVLRRYLSQHSISSQLTHSLIHYIQSHFQQSGGNAHTLEQQVVTLKLIPHSMRSELRWEAHSPILLKHPLFWYYYQKSTAAAREICDTAVREVEIPIRHELFADSKSKGVQEMVFVIRGKLSYTYTVHIDNHEKDRDEVHPDQPITNHNEDEDVPVRSKASMIVDSDQSNKTETIQHVLIQGEWSCEAALWVQRLIIAHPLVAMENSLTLLLNASEFRAVARRYPQSCLCIASYADRYVEVCMEECQQTPGRVPIWPSAGMLTYFAKYAFGSAQRTTVRKSMMAAVVPSGFSHGFGPFRRTSGVSGSSGMTEKAVNSAKIEHEQTDEE